MTLKELLGEKFKDEITVAEIEAAIKDVSLGVSPEKLKRIMFPKKCSTNQPPKHPLGRRSIATH